MKDRLQDPIPNSYGSTDFGPIFSLSNSLTPSNPINISTNPLLSKIVDLSPNIVAVYNLQTGKYIFINHALKPILGYDPSDWLEKGIEYVLKKVHPDDLKRILKENQEAIEYDRQNPGDRIVEFEYRVKNAGGEYRWLKTYGTVFDRDKDGNVKHIINISIDITAIKATEEKLLNFTKKLEQKVEERVRNAGIRLEIKETLSKNGNPNQILNQCALILNRGLQAGIVKIWTLEPEGKLNLFAFSCLEGFSKRNLPVWNEIKNGRILKLKKAYITNSLETTGDFKEKSWIKKHSLKSFAGYPLIIDNKMIGVLTIFSKSEISPQTHEFLYSTAYTIAYGIGRLRAEQALLNSEQKYRTIFSTLAEGIVLQDLNGRIIAANESAERILKVSTKELKKRSKDNVSNSIYIKEDGTFFNPPDFPYLKALETGQPQKNKVMGIVRDNRTTWISTNAIPLLDSNNRPYAVASSFQDITEQKKLEKQKDEFISIASHELKTPLTTIKSFNEILKMQFGKEEKPRYYLSKMHTEIDRLTGLVNELLDVSKIQSGSLTLRKEIVDIDKFIEEVIEDIQTTTSTHKIINKSRVEIKSLIDRHRIYQVLINLISNAIKYSPKADKIIISAKLKDKEIIFSVKDFGIGITKRDKKKVFDPFFQAITTIRQSHSGLGLGLHIAKEIVTRHSGTISVYSRKGIGSTFRFSLPINSS